MNLTLKVVSEETGGAWAMSEYEAPPGFAGPPAHRHGRMIEAFYVLKGELGVRLGEKTVNLSGGGFAPVPPGVVHTFSNPGTVPTRFLGILSPGGFERYFEELPG